MPQFLYFGSHVYYIFTSHKFQNIVHLNICEMKKLFFGKKFSVGLIIDDKPTDVLKFQYFCSGIFLPLVLIPWKIGETRYGPQRIS